MSAHTEGCNNLCLLSAYVKIGINITGIFWSVILKRSKGYFICIFWTAYNDDDDEYDGDDK